MTTTRWNWIHGKRTDLSWYIGSALVGWLYVGAVLVLGRGLEDPIRDPFLRLDAFGTTVSLTLGMVVIASWAVLIDAPHLWATLARTWLDPEEWRDRRAVLWVSLSFFALGPIAVFGPYLLGTIVPLSAASMELGAALFFVFFRLWAYYHVARQHWGFLILYKKANDDWDDPIENQVDRWFFYLALFLPIVLFAASPWYARSGMPDLYLRTPVAGGTSVATFLYPATLALYPWVLAAYAGFQWRQHRLGRPRNGPKLLLLAAIVPLHLVVFVHPLLVLFVVPVVTVGHNLQYHRLVWAFGRRKYRDRLEPGYRWARLSFRSLPIYMGAGLLFTFLFYQGPWVSFVKHWLAEGFDRWIVGGLGIVAGIEPVGSNLGARVAATFFLGWAMQHYYLDAKIWRVRRDPSVSEHLGMSARAGLR